MNTFVLSRFLSVSPFTQAWLGLMAGFVSIGALVAIGSGILVFFFGFNLRSLYIISYGFLFFVVATGFSLYVLLRRFKDSRQNLLILERLGWSMASRLNPLPIVRRIVFVFY